MNNTGGNQTPIPKVLRHALSIGLPLIERGFYGEVVFTLKVQNGRIEAVEIETRRRLKAEKGGRKKGQ